MSSEKIDVIIPFKNGSVTRLRNLLFVARYYRRHLPNAQITIVEQNTHTRMEELEALIDNHLFLNLKEQLFCRSLTFNRGYNITDREYIILADADCVPDVNLLRNIHEYFDALQTKYLVMHENVYYLENDMTEAFVLEDRVNDRTTNNFDGIYNVRTVGGCGIISRKNYFLNKGFDEKYVGWGGEDDDFYNRWYVRAYDSVGRVKYDLIHLWHHKDNTAIPQEDKFKKAVVPTKLVQW